MILLGCRRSRDDWRSCTTIRWKSATRSSIAIDEAAALLAGLAEPLPSLWGGGSLNRLRDPLFLAEQDAFVVADPSQGGRRGCSGILRGPLNYQRWIDVGALVGGGARVLCAWPSWSSGAGTSTTAAHVSGCGRSMQQFVIIRRVGILVFR